MADDTLVAKRVPTARQAAVESRLQRLDSITLSQNARTARLRIALGLVAVLLATRTGLEDETGARPDRTARGIGVVSAELQDLDGSGGASAGDVVVLGLRRAPPAGKRLDAEDVPLVHAAGDWGRGARVLPRVPDDRELRLELGRMPALDLYDTYRPGAPARSMAQIRAAKPVPILVRPSDRRAFVGDRFPDSPGLRAFHGQLHAHTGFSDGELEPADAFEGARRWGLDFFAVTDHLEQLTADEWRRGREAADAAGAPGTFVALYGFEWGGFPTVRGWMNHVNVVGTDRLPSLWSTIGLGRLYEGILGLPGTDVVAQFNHPGMNKHVIGRNNWNDFAYDARADLRVKLITVETRQPAQENHREDVGYIPALDRGWHVAPKAEEDNHRADWGRTSKRTGVWLPELTRNDLLAGLQRMATFYTDDPDATVKLSADDKWLMGSTVYGAGPHVLEVTVEHRTRLARVTKAELVGPGGATLAGEAGRQTPFRLRFEVDPDGDAWYFARVTLEDADTRLLSAPIFIDR